MGGLFPSTTEAHAPEEQTCQWPSPCYSIDFFLNVRNYLKTKEPNLFVKLLSRTTDNRKSGTDHHNGKAGKIPGKQNSQGAGRNMRGVFSDDARGGRGTASWRDTQPKLAQSENRYRIGQVSGRQDQIKRDVMSLLNKIAQITLAKLWSS